MLTPANLPFRLQAGFSIAADRREEDTKVVMGCTPRVETGPYGLHYYVKRYPQNIDA